MSSSKLQHSLAAALEVSCLHRWVNIIISAPLLRSGRGKLSDNFSQQSNFGPAKSGVLKPVILHWNLHLMGHLRNDFTGVSSQLKDILIHDEDGVSLDRYHGCPGSAMGPFLTS